MPLTITGQRRFDRDTVPPNPLLDPATPAGVQPVGLSGLTLAMSEEFNGAITVVDSGNGLIRFRDDGPQWATWYPSWPRFNAQSPGGNHTNTDQNSYYDTSKVSVAAGALVLAADKQVTVSGLAYTTGMIQSLSFFTPKYGVFEARIRLLARQANLWPAWWLSCSDYDTWPPEIDIWEHFGNGSGTNNTYESHVYGGTAFNDTEDAGDLTAWHVYSAEWRADGVRFYRDGSLTGSTSNSPATPQYLLLNNGATMSAAFSSAQVQVDYIRCWG